MRRIFERVVGGFLWFLIGCVAEVEKRLKQPKNGIF